MDIGQVVATGQSLGRIFANDVVEVSLPLDDEEMGRLGLPLAFAASANEPGPKLTSPPSSVESNATGLAKSSGRQPRSTPRPVRSM